jgi:PAS domain S-box-containing protein
MNFCHLFEGLSGVLFFAKDIHGKIIMGNKLFVHHCGFNSEEELVGKDDNEIFPSELAEQYKGDDQLIFESGQSKTNIIELFPNYLGDPIWFMTNKMPIFDRNKKIIGVWGTCQSYEDSSEFSRPYLQLAKAIDFIKENYAKKMTLETLAEKVNLSKRQFERRFKEVFKTTVHQYILKLRILKSCDMLTKGVLTTADISLDVGFFDQSAYTKHFKSFMGMTPLQYQRKKQI